MEPVEIQGRTEYLNRYFDPELTPPKTTIADLTNRQVDRLTKALVVVIHAGSIPRRLGGEATDIDLALDRKRARRVGWSVKQSLNGWSKKAPKLPIDEELRIIGAQLIWSSWYEEYMTTLTNETRLVVTWSILNDEQRWGRSAVVKFENEQNWVSYAMRS